MADIQAPAMPVPHPSRPRTRDDADPVIIRKRAYALAYMRKWREEDRAGFLESKRKYNEAHKEQRKAYNDRKKAERLAQNPPPVYNVIQVDLLAMLADMLRH